MSGNNFQEHSALSGVWFLLESAHMPILGDFPLFIPIEQSSSLSLIYIVVAGEMAEARLIEQMTKIFVSQQIKESLIILISPLGKHSSFCFTNVVHPTTVE